MAKVFDTPAAAKLSEEIGNLCPDDLEEDLSQYHPGSELVMETCNSLIRDILISAVGEDSEVEEYMEEDVATTVGSESDGDNMSLSA